MGILEEEKHISLKEFEEFREKNEIRAELILGQIYMMASPSARHQDIVGNIFFKLRQNKSKECFPRIAPFDIRLRVDNQINILQPDVMLFCEDDLCAVFEVLSPSTAHKDMGVKKYIYQKAGVKEYFLVSDEYKTIEKFELLNNKFELVNVYGIDDILDVNCMNIKIKVSEIFE